MLYCIYVVVSDRYIRKLAGRLISENERSLLFVYVHADLV